MDRQERQSVFREASKGRAERRALFGRLVYKQQLLVADLDERAAYSREPADIDLARMAREIAEGLERIGDVQ